MLNDRKPSNFQGIKFSQFTVLYPSKLSIKCEAIIKPISDRQNSSRIMFHLLVQKIQLESILKKHMRVNHMKKKKKCSKKQETRHRGEEKRGEGKPPRKQHIEQQTYLGVGRQKHEDIQEGIGIEGKFPVISEFLERNINRLELDLLNLLSKTKVARST